jgi:hypothetical protein
MQLLVVAVVVTGLLGLFNLALSILLIRGFRKIVEPASRAAGSSQGPLPFPKPGARIPEFVASTVDGRQLSGLPGGGEVLVGIFAPGCSLCQGAAAEFIELAATRFANDRALAVIEGTAEEAADYVELLSPVARVVVGPRGENPVIAALDITAFPTILLVNADGRVEASGPSMSVVPAAVAW